MVSQSKLKQIASELKRHGYEGQQHVNAVAAILESDGRASVASAVRRYLEQYQPTEETGQSTPNTSTASDNKLQDSLAGLADLLGDRIAEGIISKAVDKAVDRINSGNWTVNSKSKTKIDNLKQALDCEFEVVEENFLSLPTNGLSDVKLLESSEDIQNSEVLPESSLVQSA